MGKAKKSSKGMSMKVVSPGIALKKMERSAALINNWKEIFKCGIIGELH